MPEFGFLKKPFKWNKSRRNKGDPNSGGRMTPSDKPTPNPPTDLLDIPSAISNATDLRDPIKATTEALKKVLETAK
ncbi:hypothetical protein M408DRAFT_28139, partial [Serendipita vermifera MAFF 305830]